MNWIFSKFKMRGEIKVDMKVKIKMCKMNFSFIVSVLCVCLCVCVGGVWGWDLVYFIMLQAP